MSNTLISDLTLLKEELKSDGARQSENIVELAIKELKKIELRDDKIKDIATKFFYCWHNSPGTNTSEGFDEWWAIHKEMFNL